MRKSVFGLTAIMAAALGASSQAATVNYTLNAGVSSDEDTSSSATAGAGTATLTNVGNGSDWVWAKLTLDPGNPIELGWLLSVTYDSLTTNNPNVYISSPVLVVDADNNGINDVNDPFDVLEGAEALAGDRVIYSDFDGSPFAISPGNPPGETEYSDSGVVNRDALNGSFYWSPSLPNYKSFTGTLGDLPAGTIDATDRVFEIYFVIGGSSNFGTGADADNQTNVLSNFVVTIPEPASLGLLGLGGLLMLKRRRTA